MEVKNTSEVDNKRHVPEESGGSSGTTDNDLPEKPRKSDKEAHLRQLLKQAEEDYQVKRGIYLDSIDIPTTATKNPYKTQAEQDHKYALSNLYKAQGELIEEQMREFMSHFMQDLPMEETEE